VAQEQQEIQGKSKAKPKTVPFQVNKPYKPEKRKREETWSKVAKEKEAKPVGPLKAKLSSKKKKRKSGAGLSVKER